MSFSKKEYVSSLSKFEITTIEGDGFMCEYVSAFLSITKDIDMVKKDLKEYFLENGLTIDQPKDCLESRLFVEMPNTGNGNVYHLYLKVIGDDNKKALNVLNNWISSRDGVSPHMDPKIDTMN